MEEEHVSTGKNLHNELLALVEKPDFEERLVSSQFTECLPGFIQSMLENIVQHLIDPKGNKFEMEGLENFPNLEIFSFSAIVVCKYVIKQLSFANNYRLTAEALNYLLTSKAKVWEKQATSEIEKKICCFRLNLYILAWLCYDKKIWSKNKANTSDSKKSSSTIKENSKIVFKNFCKNIDSLQFLKDLPDQSTNIENYIFDKDFDFEKDLLITEIIPVLEEYLTFEFQNFMLEITKEYELENFKKALENVKNNTRKILHEKNQPDQEKNEVDQGKNQADQGKNQPNQGNVPKKKTVSFAANNPKNVQASTTNGLNNQLQNVDEIQPVDSKPKVVEPENDLKKTDKIAEKLKPNNKGSKDSSNSKTTDDAENQAGNTRNQSFFENFIKKNVNNLKDNIESKANHIKSEINQKKPSKGTNTIRKDLKIKKIPEKEQQPIEKKPTFDSRRSRALMPKTQQVRVVKRDLASQQENHENYLINLKQFNVHEMIKEFENENQSDNGSQYAINRSAVKQTFDLKFDRSNQKSQRDVKNIDVDLKSHGHSYKSDMSKNPFSNWKNDIVALATPSRKSYISDEKPKHNKHKVRCSDPPLSKPSQNI